MPFSGEHTLAERLLHGDQGRVMRWRICTIELPLCLRSILYQRGVYPSESFDKKKHYGLGLWVTNDEGLGNYLKTITEQMTGELQHLH